jgi:hypothetical protein
MKIRTALALMVLGAVALAPFTSSSAGNGNGGGGGPVVLVFEPTAMLADTPPTGWPTATSPWPPNGTNPSVKGMGATGWMVINQVNGQTDLQFFVRGARPNTLYTIWTVFKPLVWCSNPATGCPEAFTPVGSGSTKPGFGPFAPGALPFYAEAGLVAPTASTAKPFTSGMGLDPGATFYTNQQGNGEIHVKLDYNILGTTYDDGPPVGNSDVVAQCAVPGGAPLTYTSATSGPTTCPPLTIWVNGNPVKTTPRFTTTSSWLRKFIIQIDPKDRASQCANYDPADPTTVFWQCIDPATADPKTGTGLPRVWRYPFDHFRLASHPDELTHGFIGGSAFEHTIDMVGRRCKLQLPGEPGC